MLLKDYNKLKVDIETDNVYLDDRTLEIYARFVDIIEQTDFGFNKTELYIRKNISKSNKDLALVLDIKPHTVKNYKVYMNKKVESMIAKDFLRRLLEFNKKLLKAKVNNDHNSTDIEYEYKNLNYELDLFRTSTNSGIILKEVDTKIQGKTSSEYLLFDIADEISFLRKYSIKSMTEELNKLDLDKLIFLKNLINGDINKPDLRLEVVDMITNFKTESNKISLEIANKEPEVIYSADDLQYNDKVSKTEDSSWDNLADMMSQNT